MAKNPSIIRADGSVDTFKPVKLRRSLIRAGAGGATAKRITEEVSARLQEGMTTNAIYREAFRLLKKTDRSTAAHFSIKQAIIALGPSGYPFEQLLGRLLETQGYKVAFPDVISGKCIAHEIDVVGEKDGHRLMIEAKFHNQPGFRADIKTALYVKARADDVMAVTTNHVSEFWLATNAKFTRDAEQYAACAGLKLVGWNYPAGQGIERMLIDSRLEPITVMTTLNQREKQLLLENNLVVCTDLLNQSVRLRRLGFSNDKIHRLLSEVSALCDHHS